MKKRSFDLKYGKGTLSGGADTLDAPFLKLSEIAFEEWNSPEDKAAFRDL